MNRLYEMDTRGAVSTITINVFFFIIFGYIKLNALLLSDDFFTRNQHLQCIFGIFAIDINDILRCEVTLCRNYLEIYLQVGYAERKLMVLQALLLSMVFFVYFSLPK